LPEKWAGIWIKNQSGKGAKINIFTTLPRVAYYADESFEYIDFKKVDIDKIKASTRENGTYYLVIRGREATDSPEKARSIKENFMEVMRYEGKGLEKIIIYKRVQ
jgi:hypothetical protein